MRLAVVAAVLAAAPPAVAADGTITAEPANRYGTSEVTIAQGAGLTFVNHDLARHDVTGAAFRSPLIGTGEQAAVDGVPKLLPGRYDFHCSLHGFMTGKLMVTGLAVRILTASLDAARKQVRVRAALWPEGAVAVHAQLAGRALPVVRRPLAGAANVTLAVPAKVRRALRNARSARLAVTVEAGAATARAARTLK